MKAKDQKPADEQDSAQIPPDTDLFADRVKERLSEKDVFVGDETFYKSLGTAVHSAVNRAERSTNLSSIQKLLVAGIVLIAGVIVYAIFKAPPPQGTAKTEIPTERSEPDDTDPGKQPTTTTTPRASSPRQWLKTEALLPPTATQSLSLKLARSFYIKKDYDSAYTIYNSLCQKLPTSLENELVKDFFRLKMAMCLTTAGDLEEANNLLANLSKSRSPLVAVLAGYQRSLFDMRNKLYLSTRTRAYQAIAMLDAIDCDKKWTREMKRDCQFLAAEALTKYALLLSDADKHVPHDLWTRSDPQGYFDNITEAQLRTFLKSGAEQLDNALLGPQIFQISDPNAAPRFSAICRGASVEELISRFAANANLDIHWNPRFQTTDPRTHAQSGVAKKRPVHLYLAEATPQQILTTAAGAVGLLARPGEEQSVNIFNPTDYSSLSDHVALVTAEAISLWQKFVLTFHSDKNVANAHFVLGMLQSQKNAETEAIGEYKLVANRFPENSLAPFALLHSSKVKIKIRDYPGATKDLRQLVEQYPDSKITSTAYLLFAQTTANANLHEKAQQLYRKVFHISVSNQTRNAAAFGAGESFYKINDYQNAIRWLTRYITLEKDETSKDLCSAYLLLGKSHLALENIEYACNAFSHAIEGKLSRQQYSETLSMLVDGYIQQEKFVRALDLLENAYAWQYSRKESIQVLLLKSKILRAMGLVDKAVAAIQNKAQYTTDLQLRARIIFELSNCYIAQGDLELASENLATALISTEPGPVTHKVALRLADVCLKLGRSEQAISVCSQLLSLKPDEKTRQETLQLLARAYNQRKNYDGAALALLGKWK